MTPERVKELEEMGFAWDTNDATWFQNYFQLVKYSEGKFWIASSYGHLDTPNSALFAQHAAIHNLFSLIFFRS
jgi:hypothetical protein